MESMEQHGKRRGRLNIFQRTMLKWNEFHPYNATFVQKVPGPFDPERLRAALKLVIENFGIGKLSIDSRHRHFAYLPGSYDADLKIISGIGDPGEAVRQEVELQLNTRFEDNGSINPFRFFAAGGRDFFYLGAAYLHVIAGGYSIVPVLREIICHYLGKQDCPRLSPSDLYPGTYRRLLKGDIKGVPGMLLSPPDFLTDLRRSSKPYKMYHINNQQVGYRLLQCPQTVLPLLLTASRTWGVTVNDLFLAVILKSVSPFAVAEESDPRKNIISVGSVINISKDLGVDLKHSFGAFLSSFTVSHPADSPTVKALAGNIHEQTQRIKRKRLYLKALFGKWLALGLMTFLSRTDQMRFYPKHYPLWAGVSNINLRALSDDPDADNELDLFAGVSTGPNCPVVFCITTAGERINAGVSFRLEVFSRDDIEIMSADFLRYVDQISYELKGERS